MWFLIKTLLIKNNVTFSFSLPKMKLQKCIGSSSQKFVFVFILYFIGWISLKKGCQKRCVWKKDERGNGHIGKLSIKRQIRNLLHNIYGTHEECNGKFGYKFKFYLLRATSWWGWSFYWFSNGWIGFEATQQVTNKCNSVRNQH